MPGAGGTGLLLIQMAKRTGATVYTTVSTEEKAALAKDAGADVVINYTTENFAERIMDGTGGGGAKAVFDAVGKTTIDGSLASLSRRGYLALYGQASGPHITHKPGQYPEVDLPGRARPWATIPPPGTSWNGAPRRCWAGSPPVSLNCASGAHSACPRPMKPTASSKAGSPRASWCWCPSIDESSHIRYGWWSW